MKLTVMIEVVDTVTGKKGRQVKTVDLPQGMTAQLEEFYGAGAAHEVANSMMQNVMSTVMQSSSQQPIQPPQVPQQQQGFSPVQVSGGQPQFPQQGYPGYQQAQPHQPYMIENAPQAIPGGGTVMAGMQPHEARAAMTDPRSMLQVSKMMIDHMVGDGSQEERRSGPGHIGGSRAKPGLQYPTGQRRGD